MSRYDAAEASVALDSVETRHLQPLAADSNWRVSLQAQVVLAERTEPELVEAVRGWTPRSTRAGTPRFVGALASNPGVPILALDRLVRSPHASSQERWALAAFVGSSSDALGSHLLGLLKTESDSGVRQALVASMKKASLDLAREGLSLGLSDGDPVVRETAVVTIGQRADGQRFHAALRRALGDDASRVRAASARAVGWLDLQDSYDAVHGLLADASPDVRLQSLGALRRLDRARTQGDPAVRALVEDPDMTVRQFARRLTAQ